MLTITRTLAIDAGHRLLNHESKCRFVHGHRYAITVSFTASRLDAVGRVVDFGVIKERLGEWLDAHWDHTLLLHQDDNALGSAIDAHTGQKTYYLPYNPTAENMARYLMEIVIPKLFAEHMADGLACTSVHVQETPNCAASISSL